MTQTPSPADIHAQFHLIMSGVPQAELVGHLTVRALLSRNRCVCVCGVTVRVCMCVGSCR